MSKDNKLKKPVVEIEVTDNASSDFDKDIAQLLNDPRYKVFDLSTPKE